MGGSTNLTTASNMQMQPHLSYSAFGLATLSSAGGVLGYIIKGQVHSILGCIGFGILCMLLSAVSHLPYLTPPRFIELTAN